MFGLPVMDIDDECLHDTWPPAGSSSLIIKEEKDELFFSASWRIAVLINGKRMYESAPSDTQRSRAEINMWVRHCMRKKYNSLRELGADVDAEYVARGGKLKDLGR